MSRYAILSDVHGNLEALQAALDDLKGRDVKEIWFLGDLVGYGPDPVECVQVLLGQQDWQVRGVRGNNDQAVIEGAAATLSRLVNDLVTHHRVVMDAQRRMLIEATERSHEWTLQMLAGTEEHELLKNLTELQSGPVSVDGAVLMHASPCDPGGREGNYLRTPADAEEAFVCDEGFRIGFFGHTHHAGVFRQFTTARMYDNVQYCSAREMQEFSLGDQRVLINPGSVGQPRDGDWRAAYAVYDTSDYGKIEFYRVEYDRDRTIGRLRALCDPQRGGDSSLTSMIDVLVQRLREAG